MTITSSGNVGIGTTTPQSVLQVAGGVQLGTDGASCVAGKAGTLRYNSGNVEYCNGSGWSAFGVSGSGITALNGLTGSTQTFATPGTSGTAPNWSSGGSAHTLNIPMASTASVTAGLLSNTDYATFNSKLGAVSNTAALANGKIWVGDASGKAQEQTPSGDVTMTNAGAFTVTKIQGRGVASTAPTDGQLLVFNSGTPAYAPVSISGDASLSNSGALTLNTVSVAKGGTGASSLGANKVLTTNGTGSVVQATSCGLNQVLSFDASGNFVCSSVSALSASFQNGGNSFGAAANLGTNDGYDLNIKTNNATRMTVLAGGNVGIGTASPTVKLQISKDSTYTSELSSGISVANATSPNKMLVAGYDGTADVSYLQSVNSTVGWKNLSLNPNGGNVGIGTTSPGVVTGWTPSANYNILDITGKGANAALSDGVILLSSNRPTPTAGDELGGIAFDSKNDVSNHKAIIASNLVGSGGANGYGGSLTFYTRGDNSASVTPQMVIASTGNVGIGTTSPFSVLSNTNANIIGSDSTGLQPGNSIGWTNNTAGYVAAFYNSNTSNATANGLEVKVANNASTVNAFDVSYGATQGAAGTSLFKVQGNGNVGIGVTAPATKLDVAGSFKVGDGGETCGASYAGAIRYNGGNLQLCNSSSWVNIGASGGTTGAGAGSAGAPSLSFSGDPDTGFFDASSNNTISVSAGGTKVFDISSSGLVSPTTGGANVTTAAGTAAAPTYSFAGDAGTGWWRPAASTMAASTGGSERMRIDSSGNVGIGTASPSGLLHTYTTAFSPVRIESSNNIGSAMDIAASGSSGKTWRLLSSAASAGEGAGKLIVQNTSDSTYGLTIVASSGNVGLYQDTNPTYALSFRGNAAQTIGVERSSGANPGSQMTLLAGGAPSGSTDTAGGNLVLSSGTSTGWASSQIQFQTAAPATSGTADNSPTTKMVIWGNGNVGIGTTAPLTPLHVMGNNYTGTTFNAILEDPSSFAADVGGGIAFRGQYNSSAAAMSFASVHGGKENSTDGSPSGYFNVYTRSSVGTAVERMRINSAGNVGIGTTSPGALLDLASASNPALRISQGATAGSYVSLTDAGTNQAILAKNSPSGVSSNFDFDVNPADGTSTASLRIFRNTTTTGAKRFQILRGDGSLTVDHQIQAGTSGTTYFAANGGNVGIGTSSPATRLQVSGSVMLGDGGETCSGTYAGAIRYNGGNIQFCNSSAWTTLGASGATLGAAAGSAGSPSHTFSGDTDTGFYDASSNNVISVAAGGSKIFDLSSSGLVSPTTGGSSITTAAGTAAAPTYSFAGDTGTGWWRPAANTMAASTGGVERLRVDSSGNVGIGTTSPAANLEINSSANSPTLFSVGTPGTQSTQEVGFYLQTKADNTTLGSATNKGWYFLARGDASTAWGAGQQNYLVNGFWNGSSWISVLTLSPTGNMGIGTTVPGTTLDVNKTSSGAATFPLRLNNAGNTANTEVGLSLDVTNNGVGSRDAQISAVTNGANQISMVFRTSNAAAPAEAMRISYNGNVGIGTTSPGQALEVNGNVKAATFISTSDARLKTDIRPIAGLDLILKLTGHRYRWRSNGQQDFGLIAQEVESVLPEAVVTDENSGYKAVKYQNLVAPLIESVKEVHGQCQAGREQLQRLQASVAAHDRRIASVENDNAALKNELLRMRQQNQKLQEENAKLGRRLDAIERLLGTGK